MTIKILTLVCLLTPTMLFPKGIARQLNLEGKLKGITPEEAWEKYPNVRADQDLPSSFAAFFSSILVILVGSGSEEVKESETEMIGTLKFHNEEQLNQIRVKVVNMTMLNHRNVLNYKEYWVEYEPGYQNKRGTVYLVLPKLKMSLSDTVNLVWWEEKSGEVWEYIPDMTMIWDILNQIADLLCYFADKDIALSHTGITPDTLFITKDGRVVLVDFDCLFETTKIIKTEKGCLINSQNIVMERYLRYLPLEAYSLDPNKNEVWTSKSEVWSFGMIAAYLFIGDEPFMDNITDIIQSKLIKGEHPFESSRSKLTPNQAAFIKKIVKFNPLERPTSLVLKKLIWEAQNGVSCYQSGSNSDCESGYGSS